MTSALDRRLARRLTHHSRSALVSTVLLALAVLALWIGTETTLLLLDRPALLAAPSYVLAAVSTGGVWALPAAIGGAVLGLALVVAALAPARRARHTLDDERMTVVVEDSILAAGLARSVADGASLRHDRVRASVGRRTADVDVVPTSGLAVDRERAASDATGLLDAVAPRPRVRARVRLATQGVVGS